jgi:hypothetical protein
MKTVSEKVSDVIPVPRLMELNKSTGINCPTQRGMVVLMTKDNMNGKFTGMVVHVGDPACEYPVGDYDTVWCMDKFVESEKKITLEN